MIKKFSEYTKKNEDASTDWEDAIFEACRDEQFFDTIDSVFVRILDRAFGPEFQGERPSIEEVKEIILKYARDGMNETFDEAWSEEKSEPVPTIDTEGQDESTTEEEA